MQTVTQWFGGDVKPVHSGWYEREAPSGNVAYWYFHSYWRMGGHTAPWRFIARTPSASDDLPWRGLAEKPKAK